MNRIKSTFWVWVFVLLAVAVYQVVLIFWERPIRQENTDWYSIAEPDKEGNLLRPDHIYFTLGGNDGSYGRLAKQDEGFEDVFINSYDLMSYVMQNGKTQKESMTALPWEKEACVFSYDFAMESVVICEQLKLKEVSEGEWNEIWIMPARSRREKAMVYLLDHEKQQYLKAEAATWELEENQLLLELLRQQETVLNKSYLALGKTWSKPQFLGEFVLENSNYEEINGVKAEIIFQIGQKLNPIQAKKYALGFFQYPDTVTVREEENQLLFTNEKVTVKVDDTGLLQYVETLTDEEKTAIDMKEAYQLAVGFVKEDLGWKSTGGMDFSFAGYEIQKEGYVFNFTYLIDSIPFCIDSDLAETLRMEYPIRVTVEGSRVRRYERFVLEFSREMDQNRVLEDTWQDVLDDMAEYGWDTEGMPQLTYRLVDQKLVLYWEAKIKEGKAWIKAY
ncbi:MAG: hypothetical protein IKL38_05420 [Firmicutes bacterium]|nr:hypothetical protein [Bacillota bacterium]